jgi:hypothetical protein
MSNKLSNVERLGLADVVQRLLADGMTVGKQIAEILRTEHKANISDKAVCRYIRKIKDEVQPDAAGVFRKHINEEIPKDLQALEDIQDQSNAWWKEEPQDTGRRLAEKYSQFDAEIDFFYKELLAAELGDPIKRRKVVAKIIRRCLGYLTEDARLQKKRMEAMKMELDAIKIKLVNAGALDIEKGGNVFIVDNRSGYRPPAKDSDGRVPFVVAGGKGHG